MIAAARERLARVRRPGEYVIADLAARCRSATRRRRDPVDRDVPLGPRPRRLFRHLARSLRPGGRLVAQCGGAGNIAAVRAVLAEVGDGWPGRGRSPRPRRRAATGGGGLHAVEDLAHRRAEPIEPGAPCASTSGRSCSAPTSSGCRPPSETAFVEAVAAGLPTRDRLRPAQHPRDARARGGPPPSAVRNAAPCPGITTSAAASTRARRRSMAAWSSASGSILGRPVLAPPQVGHRVHGVVRLDDERRVLRGVARGQPQRGGRREVVAVAVVVEPQVVAVARPEVHDLRVREQRAVDRVVGMVVAEEHVGHGLWRHAEAASGSVISDRRATMPGSTMIRASASRTRTTEEPTPSPA